MIIDVIKAITVGILVAVAVAAYRQQRRGASTATRWVFLAFALLAAVTAALALLPDQTNAGLVAFGRRIVLAALPLFPYSLFQFTAALSPPPRWLQWAATGLTAAVVGSTLLVGGAQLTGESRTAWYVAALLLQWTLLSVATSVQLWRVGRGEPTIARRRMRTLAVATMALTITLLLSGAVDESAVGAAVRVIPLTSALLFLVALAPPTPVRAMWRRPAEERLRPAIADLMAATTSVKVSEVLLPHIANALGGRGVALIRPDGTVAATYGAAPLTEDSDNGRVELVELSVGRLVVFTSPYTPIFGREEFELARSLAGLAELALARGEERLIAETLQRSLLPQDLPAVPGVRLQARYIPGAGAVGGDWYDVIPLRDGRVGLVIGDVMGHGIGAAALMGQLRSALRAYAVDGDPPVTVLTRLDGLMRHLGVTELATVLYVVLDPRTSEIRFASAGHLPAMLQSSGQPATQLQGGLGPPLGIWADAPAEASAALPPGATLVLFTDGLIERREESITDSIHRLAQALQQRPEETSALPDHLLDRLLDDRSGHDDIALLLVELEDQPHMEKSGAEAANPSRDGYREGVIAPPAPGSRSEPSLPRFKHARQKSCGVYQGSWTVR
jgi:hypothetical protein